MSKYKKVGSGWKNDKNLIVSFRSQDEAIVIPPRSKLALFPIKDKLSDKHPDYDLVLNLED